ncbi:hypothetical protein T02_4734 [Trichinella nativa]|uniref:Uncharacterized protein n=1 Tax=Trichinella nativa TaxID=6335 RepID=A0A0V1L8B6_9BILA|nr:hypothetical protein T02_4734 [Trichinella nativa]
MIINAAISCGKTVTAEPLNGLQNAQAEFAIPQAEAPPIDKEKTLRNTDWLEADQTRKAEVRIRNE